MGIDGFDKFKREMQEAQQAIKALEGTFTQVKITPGDPASVKEAIRQMERAVDAKVARYRNNPLVKALVEASKKDFAEQLRKEGKKPVT